MNVNYLNDSDLDFLQHCSEEQLANFARLLTHNEKGKTRLSSVLMRNELFKSMEGHPEQHRRNWQLIAGELQHFGGDSIANKLRGHGKLYRAILLDVSKRLKLKADKEMSTFEIEQQLLEQFLRNTRKKMDEEHKQEFLHAVDARVNELEEAAAAADERQIIGKRCVAFAFQPIDPHFTHPRSNERAWAWFAARRGSGRPCGRSIKWG